MHEIIIKIQERSYYSFFISCKFKMNLFVSYTPNVLSKLLEIKAKAVLQELVLCVQHQDWSSKQPRELNKFLTSFSRQVGRVVRHLAWSSDSEACQLVA